MEDFQTSGQHHYLQTKWLGCQSRCQSLDFNKIIISRALSLPLFSFPSYEWNIIYDLLQLFTLK